MTYAITLNIYTENTSTQNLIRSTQDFQMSYSPLTSTRKRLEYRWGPYVGAHRCSNKKLTLGNWRPSFITSSSEKTLRHSTHATQHTVVTKQSAAEGQTNRSLMTRLQEPTPCDAHSSSPTLFASTAITVGFLSEQSM